MGNHAVSQDLEDSCRTDARSTHWEVLLIFKRLKCAEDPALPVLFPGCSKSIHAPITRSHPGHQISCCTNETAVDQTVLHRRPSIPVPVVSRDAPGIALDGLWVARWLVTGVSSFDFQFHWFFLLQNQRHVSVRATCFCPTAISWTVRTSVVSPTSPPQRKIVSGYSSLPRSAASMRWQRTMLQPLR